MLFRAASFYAFLATLFLHATSLPLDVNVTAAELVLSIDIPPTIDDVGKFILSGTLKNAGPQAISVVRDPDGLLFGHVPVGALSFTNTKTGKSPNFIGAIVKWSLSTYLADPDAASPAQKEKRASGNSDDQDTNSDGGTSTSSTSYPGTTYDLEPAQSMKIKYNVGEGYDFTDSGAGEYDVKLARDYFWVLVDANGEPVEAKVSMQGIVKITNVPASSSEDAASVTPVQGDKNKRDPQITTNKCTEDQAFNLYRAAESADEAVDDSLHYLKKTHTGERPRYEQWFGSWDAPPPIRGDQSVSPRDEVNRIFSTIQRFAAPAQPNGYTYECSCKINVYAYVQPKKTQNPIIHLCNWFWSAAVPIEGKDSKSGTLIHEATHFENAGHSFDIASGQKAAHELAEWDPVLAVASANNYEYFAENEPFLG